MSALQWPQARKNKPDSFTTYTEVEVDIDAHELEKAGWRYVGKDEGPTERSVLDVVHAWHDEAHEGPWRWCAEQPCDTLRGRESDA